MLAACSRAAVRSRAEHGPYTFRRSRYLFLAASTRTPNPEHSKRAAPYRPSALKRCRHTAPAEAEFNGEKGNGMKELGQRAEAPRLVAADDQWAAIIRTDPLNAYTRAILASGS